MTSYTNMRNKILYGICGIGSGHTYRQLPMVEHFAGVCDLMIFAYGASFDFYTEHFKGTSVKVLEVAVPFFVGNKNGIDIKATAEAPANKNKDFIKINCAALSRASRELGKPDLVISDYEPVSARYAYANGASLVTIDQQSKYLCGDFPEELGGYGFKDEIARLLFFFPRADARIACSFFNFPIKTGMVKVHVFPPVIKNSVLSLQREPVSEPISILVYISAAREFSQTFDELTRIFSKMKEARFHLFAGENRGYSVEASESIRIYSHGDPRFIQILGQCRGIISTAGHSLLSEAMYLGIPVYAIPVSPYEQHMSAHIIDKYGFGVAHGKVEENKLAYFIHNIPRFENAIRSDTKVLLRGIGQEKILGFIRDRFFI